MRKLTRSILATTAVVGLLALPVAGAGATNHTSNQIIEGTVGSSVSIDTPPADVDFGTLPATGANAGTIVVSSNEAYTLSIQAGHDFMTLWDETDGYDANTQLASKLVLTAANADPVGNPGAVGTFANADTTGGLLGSNALSLLLNTTDTYNITGTQPATALDRAGDYRLEVTYTAAPAV